MSWTREWWDQHSGECELLSSAAVIAELSRGKSDMVGDRIKMLEATALLSVTAEVEEIAHVYISKMLMPKDPQGDALHLAIASFHRADILLTWNCVHLANANKFDRIRLINYEIGLPTPILTTPLNILSGGQT